MSYNVKNYTEQNGEKTVIGGELVINGKLTAGTDAEITGVVTPAENQAASSATTVAALASDFNNLLTKLKAAGLMVADSE